MKIENKNQQKLFKKFKDFYQIFLPSAFGQLQK